MFLHVYSNIGFFIKFKYTMSFRHMCLHIIYCNEWFYLNSN
jgi:hypothetical protein